MITTKSVEFTDANGSLRFEVSSSGGLVVSCVGGQPWELADEQTMEVYALLDQAIVADKWIGREKSSDCQSPLLAEAFLQMAEVLGVPSEMECARKRLKSPGVWCCDKHMEAYEREIAAAYERRSPTSRQAKATIPQPGPDVREATVQAEDRRVPRHEDMIMEVRPVADDFDNLVRNTP